MTLIKTTIQRPVTVSMFVVAVILFGIVSLDRLALNLLPDISYPSLTIQTDYEDAAPEEIEALITQPIEEAVGVVPGLSKMTSVSRSGQSEVVMEFGWDTAMDIASLEVREKLDFVNLPRDADKPIILRFDPSHDPIMRVRVFGDLSLPKLRYLAEKELKKYLESTDGVAAIKVIGGLEEQIRVEVDEQRLAELGIPISEVTEVLRQENLNQATGSLYDQDANYLVRMLNQFRTVDEIQNIVVRDEEGRKILLSDVATAVRGTKDREIIARLDGSESVEMAIYKEGDANTVGVSRAVIRQLDRLKENERLFPEGVDYQVVSNQAQFIEQSVDNVLTAAIFGGLLAVIVLFVFLRDLRSTLTIGFSIPISIMATFALMYQTDITLNIMSLGGVALGVGMLVDNSIVVLEAIDRHRKKGVQLVQSVYQGATEVSRAVTASTLTTVAVFLPLIFVEGIAGQLFRDQALTITYSLLASLLVALAFIPMLLARKSKAGQLETEPEAQAVGGESGGRIRKTLQRVRRGATRVLRFLFVDILTVLLTDLRQLLSVLGRALEVAIAPALNSFDRGFATVSRWYPRLLNWALENKAMVFALVLILGVGAFGAFRNLGAELIPPLTQGEFSFEVRLPEGRPLAYTDRILREVELKVAEFEGVGVVFSSVGGSTENQFARNSVQENQAQLYVVMQDKRDFQGEARVIARIRELLRDYPEVTYRFERPTLFSFRTPVEVEIYSYNLANLRSVSELVTGELGKVAGLSDIKTSTQPGDPEIHVFFDRQKLARLGLNESDIATLLRNKIRGDVASRFREDDKQIDILVRASESYRETVEDLSNLTVNVTRQTAQQSAQPDGSVEDLEEAAATVVPIRLGAVADIQVDRGPSEIRRIRGQRAALVSANLSGRDLTTVSAEIRQRLDRLRSVIPGNTVVAVAGQNEELRSSYQSLAFAFSLAVFLVYLVMASQFESLVHPFIIIFCVPLAVIGVLFSLWITGTTVSVMVFLGVIILAGIVVNNAIVLIDYTNQLRAAGSARRQALLEAGQVRLRPIIMTTLTTVLGLVPMALGWGEGAEVRAPMAITVMGGLLFSTLLTLVFIPVVYDLVDRKVFAADPLRLPGTADSRTDLLGDGLQPSLGE